MREEEGSRGSGRGEEDGRERCRKGRRGEGADENEGETGEDRKEER